jgi:hypothetical protein
MNKVEQAVLHNELGDVSPRLAIRCRTRMDTGRWWIKDPIWLLALDDRLVLLAASRRRYIQQVPFSELAQSYYCHQTGELVLAPYEELTVNQMAMKASEAIHLLRVLGLET